MKKMLLAATLWPSLLQDVLNRRLLFKTNQRQCRAKPSPLFLRFLELEQKKTVDAAKIYVAASIVKKQKPQQTFVNSCSVLLF